MRRQNSLRRFLPLRLAVVLLLLTACASVRSEEGPNLGTAALDLADESVVADTVHIDDAPLDGELGEDVLVEQEIKRGDEPAISLDDLSWRKGDYRIVPYGIGWVNAAYDTERTVTGPFVLYVNSRDIEGKADFHIEARATRLGLDFTGPPIGEAEYGGKVEIDFFGEATTENRPGVLLRHAYGEFRRDGWRFLGGQTWDLISPLVPDVLNYSVAWAAGNIGYRRAQLRVEKESAISNTTGFIWQASLNDPVVSDFATDTFIEGHDAGWPTVMGRLALVLDPDTASGAQKPATFGVSSHIGQERADFETAPVEQDRLYTSWSLNADMRVPLSRQAGVQGEFFWGSDLGTYLGGINQGIDRGTRQAIRSMGGWIEFWYDLNEEWHTHAGAGIDDPRNGDLSAGRRSQNVFYFANLVWQITPMLNVGFETSWWNTKYVALAPGEALRLETVVRYSF